jgi:TM2 domain-containing membrane protein YozV
VHDRAQGGAALSCSKCGADNAEGARFCAKWGAALAVAAPEPAPAASSTMRSTNDVASSAAGAVASTSPSGKNPVLAVVLSLFITGLGQFYNSDFKKGALMFVGAILGFFFTGGPLTITFWIWSMADGYQVAAGKGKPW